MHAPRCTVTPRNILIGNIIGELRVYQIKTTPEFAFYINLDTFSYYSYLTTRKNCDNIPIVSSHIVRLLKSDKGGLAKCINRN